MKKNNTYITYKIQGHKWTPCGELHADAQSLLALCKILKEENPYMRLGQIAFNVCDIWWPDETEQYRSSEYDPFYIDDRSIDFILRVLYDVANNN